MKYKILIGILLMFALVGCDYDYSSQNNNRLETIDRALNGESIKTHIQPKYWIAGARGDKKALAYILDHNEKDVIALEDIWLKLNKFVSKTNCSI